ncbi:hypothetical protein FKR81_15970 [Lentzea tibetensis]|uniref:Uncharacterized protein n=1 Tax=Lentzea tibetensis TaxID=2591470 RepID=A0A563ETY0_9PSEU|nr:hypothetical protein [Lentzea tibetensis]TWP51126.1 hypothetical protein FKR81_15970 [Lentzea tibetensis]
MSALGALVLNVGSVGSGTAVVRATLTSGVASGVTTGFDLGGALVVTADGRGREELDDGALYSMGGSSPPMFVIAGSAAGSRTSSTGEGPGPVPSTTPTTSPSSSRTAPMDVMGSGRPGRTAGTLLAV